MRCVFIVALLLVGCASAPKPSEPQAVSALASCADLSAEIARTDEARLAAQHKKEDAWKVVVPFVVIGRYVSAKHDIGDAEQRLEELKRESAVRGCPA